MNLYFHVPNLYWPLLIGGVRFQQYNPRSNVFLSIQIQTVLFFCIQIHFSSRRKFFWYLRIAYDKLKNYKCQLLRYNTVYNIMSLKNFLLVYFVSIKQRERFKESNDLSIHTAKQFILHYKTIYWVNVLNSR